MGLWAFAKGILCHIAHGHRRKNKMSVYLYHMGEAAFLWAIEMFINSLGTNDITETKPITIAHYVSS